MEGEDSVLGAFIQCCLLVLLRLKHGQDGLGMQHE